MLYIDENSRSDFIDLERRINELKQKDGSKKQVRFDMSNNKLENNPFSTPQVTVSKFERSSLNS